MLLQQGGDARQAPLDVAAAYKCCAIAASIDARVGDRASIDPLVHASGVCQGALQGPRASMLCLGCASFDPSHQNAYHPLPTYSIFWGQQLSLVPLMLESLPFL